MEDTVFVVDNNDINLMLAERCLEDSCNVFTMRTAQKMFAMLDQITPHLILIDVDMQDMDCFDVLSRLKSNKKSENIPVVIMTGSRDTHVDKKGIEMGATDLLIKPFSPSLFHSRVKLYIRATKTLG